MRLGAAPLLVLLACGTSRSSPSPLSDAGIGAPPLSVVLTPQPFAPVAITINDDGDFVVLDGEHAALDTLSHDGLARLGGATFGDAGAWSLPRLVVGRPGTAFVDAEAGLFAVDLANEAVTALGTLPPHHALRALRAEVGVALATDSAVERRTFDDGGSLRSIPATQVVDLAPFPDGQLAVVRGDTTGCTRVELLAGDAGSAGSFGAPPCLLALARDRSALWLAAQGDGGTELRRFDTHTLGEQGRWRAEGLSLRGLVLSDDGAKVALLGDAPGPTVAVARSVDLTGAAPFRFLGPPALPSAADAVFDDADALYIADPRGRSIGLVR